MLKIDLRAYLFGLLFGAFAMLFTASFVVACDTETDAVRADSDLESEVRSRSGLSNPRFNSITLSPPAEGGSITLTAGGSVSTVEVADGWATCVGSGKVTPRTHLIGADLKSGVITVAGDETITCEASATSEPKPATYDLWVGSVQD